MMQNQPVRLRNVQVRIKREETMDDFACIRCADGPVECRVVKAKGSPKDCNPKRDIEIPFL